MSNEADTVKLETELEQLTCEQLRQELLDIGENPGPIDLATKQVFKFNYECGNFNIKSYFRCRAVDKILIWGCYNYFVDPASWQLP